MMDTASLPNPPKKQKVVYVVRKVHQSIINEGIINQGSTNDVLTVLWNTSDPIANAWTLVESNDVVISSMHDIDLDHSAF